MEWIHTGYYGRVFRKAGGDSGACNMSGYPTPLVSGHVCTAACGAVHKHTGLLSIKRFFCGQTGAERPQPTPVPEREIHPNIYISVDPAPNKWFGLDDLQRCLHTSGILLIVGMGQMSMLSISSLKFQDITTSKNLSLSNWKRNWGEDRFKWNA